MPRKIGVLRGREDNFPNALREVVERKTNGKIVVEPMEIGAVQLRKKWEYDLIVDRISHDVPYYRYILKSAAAEGAYVIPNPFQWSADDKMLGFNLADRLGIPIPRTVILPSAGSHNLYDITPRSLRNLKWLNPGDWEEIFEFVGFPGWLKPASGGGWLAVKKIHNRDEFWFNYNHEIHHEEQKLMVFDPERPDWEGNRAIRRWLSRTLVCVYQQDIAFDKFARCWYLGGDVVIARFIPPDRVAGQRLGTYEHNPEYFGEELIDKLTRHVRVLHEALGYEINTAEFVIKDGVPYAIDFLNFACDLDVGSIGPYFAELCIGKVADYLIACVENPNSRLQRDNPVWTRLMTAQPLDDLAKDQAPEHAKRRISAKEPA